MQNDPDKEYNMPKDGTVHELTSNVSPLSTRPCVGHSLCLSPRKRLTVSLPQAILFLQQLLDFQETAGAMLASQGKTKAAPPPLRAGLGVTQM